MQSLTPQFAVLTVLFCLTGCSGKPDLQAEREKILSLLKQERKAHFERNADLFVSEFSDSMISVNKGEVITAFPGQRRDRIQGYFDRSEFIKWDDVTPPVIRFSDDGTMAYAIVQKLVILTNSDSTGNKVTDTTEYAWVSIYGKQQGQWKITCNISTNK